MNESEAAYKSAVAELESAQRLLGQTPRTDPEAREAAAKVVESAVAAVKAAKERVKQENTSRNFAGLQTPLFESVAARFPPDVVSELAADALSRQQDREQRAAERRAQKQAAAVPEPPPAPPRAAPPGRPRTTGPEILKRRPHAGGNGP